MTFEETRKLALALMQEHGLHDWAFRFNRARRRMGVCFYPAPGRQGRIELSVYFVANNPDEEIRETILHEIAHALAGSAAGHGPAWKAVCLRIGAKPQRCGSARMPRGAWLAQCPGCKAEITRHKRPRTLTGYHCVRCGPDKGKLTWRVATG
jgi:predicted SprT family Zn-dependent metalloprotease